MILEFKKILLRLFYYIQWGIQRFKLSCDKNKYESISMIELQQPSLLIVPHADDELIGCYGLISSNLINDVIYCGYATDEMADIRQKELNTFMSRFSSKLIVSEGRIEDDILNLLNKNRYKSIFLPSPLDWHPDHRGLSNMLLDCLSNIADYNPDIYLYTITVPHCEFGTLEYRALSNTIFKNKWSDFERCYKSQLHLPIRRFKQKERIQGYMCSKDAVELYMYVTVSELKFFYTECKKREKLLCESISIINNLEKIFLFSRKFSEYLKQ